MAVRSKLFSELVRLETELWNAVDGRLRLECDLPLSRFEPMQIIDRLGTCRVNDIANELVITVGGISKLVDRIEAAGLCRRWPNPDDRRSSNIELTDAGRRVLADATITFEEELELRFGDALSEGAAEQLTETLGRLRTAGHAADETGGKA